MSISPWKQTLNFYYFFLGRTRANSKDLLKDAGFNRLAIHICEFQSTWQTQSILQSHNLRRQWQKGHFALVTWTAKWPWRTLTFVLSTLPTGINQLSFFTVGKHSSLSKTITPIGGWHPPGPRFSNYHWGLAFLAACVVTWLSSRFPIWMWMSLSQFAHMISQTQEGTRLDAERCNHYYHCGKDSHPWYGSHALLFIFLCQKPTCAIHFGGTFTCSDECPFALDSSRIQFPSQMGLLFMFRIPDFSDIP